MLEYKSGGIVSALGLATSEVAKERRDVWEASLRTQVGRQRWVPTEVCPEGDWRRRPLQYWATASRPCWSFHHEVFVLRRNDYVRAALHYGSDSFPHAVWSHMACEFFVAVCQSFCEHSVHFLYFYFFTFSSVKTWLLTLLFLWTGFDDPHKKLPFAFWVVLILLPIYGVKFPKNTRNRAWMDT